MSHCRFVRNHGRGDYLYKRIPFIFEFFDEKDHSELQLGNRDTIRKEWPSRTQRAIIRWTRTKELSQIARAKRQRLDQATEEKEEVIRSMVVHKHSC